MNKESVKTDPNKVECIKELLTPKHKKDVYSFLGTVGYCRHFVFGYSEISGPLTRLTTKDTQFSWSEECDTAFRVLRQKLMEVPILAYSDNRKGFILDTDTSDVRSDTILFQMHNGEESIVRYFSKTPNTEK